MWESRLSGSEKGRVATRTTGAILWHRRETRRQTENTHFALPSGKCPAYSKPQLSWEDRVQQILAERGDHPGSNSKGLRKRGQSPPFSFADCHRWKLPVQ
jgi:hypothetical protein